MQPDELDILQKLGLIITVAAIFLIIGRLVRMPTIVVYLAAGLFLGPLTGWVGIDESISLISELGIVLLLFLVGLELSFEKIKDIGKVAVVAGVGQVLFTALGGWIICVLLGFSLTEALFLATALTFSSTVVVVKLLDFKGELNTLYGRIAVGIFLVQDIVVIFILTFLAGIGGTDGGDQNIWMGLLMAFGGMTALLLVCLFASKYLLPKPFAWAARSPDTILIWALCWCFGMVLIAEKMHLSVEIGSFLAGIALAQLPYSGDLKRRLHPLMNLFVAVFFVSLGIKMDFGDAAVHWDTALILSLFVLVGNPLIFIVIIYRMGYAARTAFFTSVTVAQISEFSFIFVTMGVTAGLVDSSILSITAVVGLITIALSSYMILYSEQLYRWCSRLGLLALLKRKEEPQRDSSAITYEKHWVIIGMNTLGRLLVERLSEKGERVLAVDVDPVKLEKVRPQANTLLGNVEYESVVNEAGIPHAKGVVSALQIEDTNHLLAYRCRIGHVPFAVHAFDPDLVDELLELGADYLMTPVIDGIQAQSEILKEKGAVN